jgi:hypothetical protein
VAGPNEVLGPQQGREKAPMAWPRGSDNIYVLDLALGQVWTSRDYGNLGSWESVWPVENAVPIDEDFGYIASDAQSPDSVWLTDETTVYRGTVTDTSACFPSIATPSDFGLPGPVKIRPATTTVFVAAGQGSEDAALWEGTPSGGTVCLPTVDWDKVASDPNYLTGAVFPRALSVTKLINNEGFAHVGTGGQGPWSSPD